MDIIDLNERYDFDVYFAFVVQEEVGLRGSAILETAVKHGIPFQMKRRTAGGTDAGRLARRGRGVPAGVISIPARYIHSPLSIMDLGDYRNTFELVKSVVEDGKIVEEVSG
ncbi:MAG: hypothetical protein B5M49_02190 [Thermotoga sp. 4484_232]|nr:MAG: hypothetical protein B5M49_02190 [Thermotoga sp. 4484_232]